VSITCLQDAAKRETVAFKLAVRNTRQHVILMHDIGHHVSVKEQLAGVFVIVHIVEQHCCRCVTTDGLEIPNSRGTSSIDCSTFRRIYDNSNPAGCTTYKRKSLSLTLLDNAQFVSRSMYKYNISLHQSSTSMFLRQCMSRQ
jgi:hypothetical protein